MKKILMISPILFLTWAYAKVSPNYLFFVELKNNECVWNLALPPDLLPKEINRTKGVNVDGETTCSKHIVFSKLKPEMFYIDQDTVYLLEFKNGKSTKQTIAKLPDQFVNTKSDTSFNISDNNNPIFAKMIPTDDLKTKPGSGDEIFIIYKDKKYLDPGYGTRMIVELFELVNGKWKNIKTEITTTEAPDARGMDVLKELKPNNYNSLKTKLEKSDALFNNSLIKFNDIEHKQNLKLVNKTLKEAEEDPFDPYKYIPIDAKKGILSNIVSGDYPHYTLPIFLCENKCAISKKFETHKFESSVGIHLNSDGYFLIGEENGNARTQVFSVRGTKPLKTFEKSIFATWLKQDYL